MTRRIGVVTVGRSDYGIYYPLLRAIRDDVQCQLCLIAGGAHLSPVFGNTLSEIEGDGFEIGARVPMLLSGDSPEEIAMSMGVGVINFTNAYRDIQPNLLVLLGDRFEMLAAAIAALPLRIPVAHLHGGELTQGAMDDSIRHAISKLSHLHFAAAAAYGRRIEQMGEEPRRIFVTGSPVVDAILTQPAIPKDELEKELGARLENALLVTYHPVTLEHERTEECLSTLLTALSRFENEILFTYPNADMGNAVIIDHVQRFAASRPRTHIFVNLGRRKYHSLQRYVAAMVGNSSSGIIEASIFKLPVVNIGDRQMGRLRTRNIIDVPDEAHAIERAIQTVLSPQFRESISQMEHPYGKGDASKQILQTLKTVPLNGSLLKKRFHDLPRATEASAISYSRTGDAG
ncbi:MAG: UDP-N-acetylglucosamine 2-epimerase [Candidatus Acidiferrales bacterium]